MTLKFGDLLGRNEIRNLNDQALEMDFKISSLRTQLDALSRSTAVIEFTSDGIVADANSNFLNTFGYGIEEVVGKHHRMFVLPSYKSSPEYSSFWQSLRKGDFFAGEFLRVGKNGREIWIQATYNPVIGKGGQVEKVVKYATDITTTKRANALVKSQTDAMNRAFAVIEFDLRGTILDANQNFLETMGYRHSEVVGKHHSMFVTEEYAISSEYRQFWENLRGGHYHHGEFHRIGNGQRDVYIQASYSPIFGIDGSVSSVIKYASNITDAMNARLQSKTISRSVCTSVNEMTSTIAEISRNVSSTALLARAAEEMSVSANCDVQQLGDESRSIENVVDMIRDLTDQTNLLALNATIESARAGNAGKGFAVVASEVKELARQTASATKSIEQTVHQIQNKVGEVISSMESISSSVTNVNANMNMIAAAIEEQSTAMSSIASTAMELERD